MRALTLCVLLPLLSGCSATALQAFAEGIAAASAPAGANGLTAGGGADLLLFGGEGHKTFLGCLKCNKYDDSSLLNRYGSYGSKYSSTSIFNRYGEFGSKYSAYSPCNGAAGDPPVIVDRSGNFFGRLTVNAYHPQASRLNGIAAFLAAVCSP